MSSTRTHTIITGSDLEHLFENILDWKKDLEYRCDLINIQSTASVIGKRIYKADLIGIEYFKDKKDGE